MVPQLLPQPGLAMPGPVWGATAGSEVRASWAAGRQDGRPSLPQGKRCPCLGWVQQFGHSTSVNIFYLKMTLHGTHNNKAFSFQCFASNGPGFGADSSNKRKIKGKRRQKDTGLEPSKQVIDKQFMEKVEAVRRSALEKKKAEENKNYLAIDYDAPIESDKSTIGFGTRVGIGVALEKKKAEENKIYLAIDYDAPIESDKSTIGFGTRVGIGVAVVVFGLVFAFGDFLPSGSVSPSKENTVAKQNLSKRKKRNLRVH